MKKKSGGRSIKYWKLLCNSEKRRKRTKVFFSFFLDLLQIKGKKLCDFRSCFFDKRFFISFNGQKIWLWLSCSVFQIHLLAILQLDCWSRSWHFTFAQLDSVSPQKYSSKPSQAPPTIHSIPSQSHSDPQLSVWTLRAPNLTEIFPHYLGSCIWGFRFPCCAKTSHLSSYLPWTRPFWRWYQLHRPFIRHGCQKWGQMSPGNSCSWHKICIPPNSQSWQTLRQ